MPIFSNMNKRARERVNIKVTGMRGPWLRFVAVITTVHTVGIMSEPLVEQSKSSF